MAEEALTEDLDDEMEVQARPRGGWFSGKKLVMFIVLPIVLLGGVGAGVYLLGLADSLLGIEHDEEGEDPAQPLPVTPGVFYALPEMLVNLNTGGRSSSFLKISVSLELAKDSDIDRLNTVLPRIMDSFQVYLRELRIEDLSGSGGLQRLREELLLRVNAATRPVVVRDVLFKEILVQ